MNAFSLKRIGLLMACWLSATLFRAQTADSIRLLFVGDLMQHQAQMDAAKRPDCTYDYTSYFRQVRPEFDRADLLVGNLEVTLGGKPYRGYPAFSAPDEFLYELKRVGFDVLLTANNHCLDRGRKGLERTVRMLDSLEIPHAGTYREVEERSRRYPLLVTVKGFRIVLLNYTYGTNGIPVTPPNYVNGIDRAQIREDILKARRMKPDVIIACMHWGIEYQSLPRRQERELARWMIGLGVDHVIGSHPHVVQPLEVLTDSVTPGRHLVAYSLGNFVSNMHPTGTDGGMMVSLTLRRVEGRTRLADCGYAFVWTSRPVLSRKPGYELYPLNIADNLLNVNEKERMSRFARQVRSLMERETKGIKEYFF